MTNDLTDDDDLHAYASLTLHTTTDTHIISIQTCFYHSHFFFTLIVDGQTLLVLFCFRFRSRLAFYNLYCTMFLFSFHFVFLVP